VKRWSLFVEKPEGPGEPEPQPVFVRGPFAGPNRRMRRGFIHAAQHQPRFTSGNVLYDPLNLLSPEELAVNEERLRKRRGKTRRWVQKRRKRA